MVLSRAVGDFAISTSALVPWNSRGAYMAAALGVATFIHTPFATFSRLILLLTTAIAFA